jgi:membrane protease YdiL (CAAX protease family)
MLQLSKYKAVLYHLYPGVIITAGFTLLAPVAIKLGFPPQAGMLIAILVFALPTLFIHLFRAKKSEKKNTVSELNGLTNKLPVPKLILYSSVLVFIAFIVWGITQPVNVWISNKIFGWLPERYTIQDFKGYSVDTIKITLILNILLNGILAPVVEEFYFRGYLLSRMKKFGNSAFWVNAVLFSFYHFWQPYLYLTLILSLLPMTYMVWKTKSLQLAIWTHCLLNCIGAILSFGYLLK